MDLGLGELELFRLGRSESGINLSNSPGFVIKEIRIRKPIITDPSHPDPQHWFNLLRVLQERSDQDSKSIVPDPLYGFLF